MGKVAAVPSTAKFLETVKASGLLPAEVFAKFEQKYSAAADAPTAARGLISEGLVTRWQASQLLNGAVKFQIGKYKLLDQIASNETGRVYLAEHGQLSRRVALKVLASRFTSKPEVVKRFLAEARVAASIDHRNIVHVYDVARETDRTYLVTEYFAGQDLAKLVAGGPLTADRALAILRQVTDGLAQAHEQKICHGALRPSTVLVDSQGAAKITDLGVGSLAEAVKPTSLDESAELPTDVLAYAAPEQNTEPTVAADIFALGGILYLLLTGEPPSIAWRANGAAPAGKEVLTALKKKAAAAPEDLLKLCAIMLATKPEDRPPNVAGVQKALDLLQNKSPAKLPLKSEAMAKAAPKPETSGGMPKISLDVGGDKPTAKPAAKEPAKTPPAAAPGKPLKAKPLAASGANPVIKAKAAPSGEMVFDSIEITEDTVEAVAEEDTQDSAFPGFAINVGAPAKPATKPAAAPAKKEKAVPAVEAPETTEDVVATSDEAAAAPAPAKSKLPLILGISIGGGVLALAAMIGLVFMLSGGDKKNKQIASANVDQEETPPVIGELEKPAEENPAANPNPNPNPSLNPSPNPSPNPIPAVNPAVPENTNPAPPENPTVDPAPTEPPPAEPMPTEPPPETKPTPPPEPMPAPTPPKEKPKGNPFDGFPKFVSLPSLGSKGAVPAEALQEAKLGPAKLAGLDCFVDLYGGDGAFKGKQRFTLEPGNGGTSTTDWDIRLQAGESDPAPVVIAKLSAKEDSLVFQWQAAAVEAAAAPHLCNCIIRLRAGQGTHDVALRTPLGGDPLVLTSAKAISGRYTVEFPPDPAKCKIEFLGVEGSMPGHKFEKRAVGFEANDPGIVWLGMAPNSTPLGVALKSSLSRQLQFTGMFLVKTENDQKPGPFNRKNIEMTKQRIIGGVQQANFAIDAQSKNANAEQKKQITAQINAEIVKMQKAANEYDDVLKAHELLKEGATMHFKVFYETGENGMNVVLISTKG